MSKNDKASVTVVALDTVNPNTSVEGWDQLYLDGVIKIEREQDGSYRISGMSMKTVTIEPRAANVVILRAVDDRKR